MVVYIADMPISINNTPSENDREMIVWLVDASLQAMLDALAIIHPDVAVSFTRSSSYLEFKRAWQAGYEMTR